MHWVVEEVPWANLFRTVVTTLLFFVVIGATVLLPISMITGVGGGPVWAAAVQLLALHAFVLASIVVWSDRVRWIGDPERPDEDKVPATHRR